MSEPDDLTADLPQLFDDLTAEAVTAWRTCIAERHISPLEAWASFERAHAEDHAGGGADAHTAAVWWLGALAVVDHDWPPT